MLIAQVKRPEFKPRNSHWKAGGGGVHIWNPSAPVRPRGREETSPEAQGTVSLEDSEETEMAEEQEGPCLESPEGSNRCQKAVLWTTHMCLDCQTHTVKRSSSAKIIQLSVCNIPSLHNHKVLKLAELRKLNFVVAFSGNFRSHNNSYWERKMMLCLIRGIRREYVLGQGEWVGIPTNKDREEEQSR